MQKVDIRSYAYYKLTASLYAGTAMGSIFVIYAALPPALFSAGGVALAFGGWVLAFFYMRLMRFSSFFLIGFSVEIFTLSLSILFLLFNHFIWIAIVIYGIYQFLFLFGNYLARAETKLFAKTALFSIFDRMKQLGYLGGLLFSFLFYETADYLGINVVKEQVFYLYFALFTIQLVVLFFYLKAFWQYLPLHPRHD